MVYGAMVIDIITKRGSRYVRVKSHDSFMSYVYSHSLSDIQNAMEAAKRYAVERGWSHCGGVHLGVLPQKANTYVAVFDGVRS